MTVLYDQMSVIVTALEHPRTFRDQGEEFRTTPLQITEKMITAIFVTSKNQLTLLHDHMTVLHDQMTVSYDQTTALLTALEHSRAFGVEGFAPRPCRSLLR